MKKLIFFCALILGMILPMRRLLAQPSCMLYQDARKPLEGGIDDLLKRLTLQEKAMLFAGKDMWHFDGVERLGIPAIQITDCGHGITVILDENGNYTGCDTCFPTAVAKAASWNKKLITELGSTLGKEARATGSSLLLEWKKLRNFFGRPRTFRKNGDSFYQWCSIRKYRYLHKIYGCK